MTENTLNFEIIKPGYMDECCKNKPLTEKQKCFLEKIRDPVILSLLNDYISENAWKYNNSELIAFFDRIPDEFPEWMKLKGYDNL